MNFSLLFAPLYFYSGAPKSDPKSNEVSKETDLTQPISLQT